MCVVLAEQTMTPRRRRRRHCTGHGAEWATERGRVARGVQRSTSPPRLDDDRRMAERRDQTVSSTETSSMFVNSHREAYRPT